jgi:hypothetical protein
MTFQCYGSRQSELGLSMNRLRHLTTAVVFLSMTIASPTLAQNVVEEPVSVASNFIRARTAFRVRVVWAPG